MLCKLDLLINDIKSLVTQEEEYLSNTIKYIQEHGLKYGFKIYHERSKDNYRYSIITIINNNDDDDDDDVRSFIQIDIIDMVNDRIIGRDENNSLHYFEKYYYIRDEITKIKNKIELAVNLEKKLKLKNLKEKKEKI